MPEFAQGGAFEANVGKGRLIVHVGLPKTATSTLQTDFFPFVADEGETIYVGVDGARRSGYNNEIYDLVMEAISSGENISEVNSVIRSYLDRGITLILSEEMITVSVEGLGWPEKLKRLSQVIDGTNYELVVTVREPTTALFSYYVELYPRFIGSNFLDCAKNSEALGIFRYGWLIDVLLSNFERKKVHLFQFESIIMGDVGGLMQLINPDRNNELMFSLRNHNSRVRNNGYVKRQESVSAGNYLVAYLKRIGAYKYLPSTLKGKLRPYYRFLFNKVLFEAKIPYPGQEEIHELKKFLESDLDLLNKEFGIDYHA